MTYSLKEALIMTSVKSSIALASCSKGTVIDHDIDVIGDQLK